MGNICHAGPVLNERARERTASGSPRAIKKPLTFGRDPTLKREDFIFSHATGPSSLTKLPGSINGQQFLIENCSDCDIFLLDHCASVQIDECINCRIVVGPCESSLFLRNCKDCTIVCAVQQFRTRDCENIDAYVYSSTEPIIETSAKMRFACFPLTYFSLQQQFEKAGFSIWNNRWSEIYNFTPDHGTWKSLSTHCHQSPMAAIKSEVDDGVALWKMPTWTAEELGVSVNVDQLVVPLTSGISARKEDASGLIVVFVTPLNQLMMDFVTAMTKCTSDSDTTSNPILLIRTRQIKLTTEQAKLLLATNPMMEKAADAAKDSAGSVIMEFQGAECLARVAAVLQDAKFAGAAAISDSIFTSPDQATARRLSELVFVQWKETV